MRKRSPSLKLSLLSYAVAAATAGMMPGAHGQAVVPVIDLCAGSTSITISTDAGSGHCTVDTAGAQLDITSAGILRNTLDVSSSNPVINNAGLVTESVNSSGLAWASAILAGPLGAGAAITNTSTGTVSASSTSTSGTAQADGIRVGALSGGATISNSGAVTITAEGDGAAFATGIGDQIYATHDAGHIVNTASGVVTVTANDHGGGYSAQAYGLYANSALTNGSSIANAGTVTVSATAEGPDSAYAYALYSYYGLVDSSISNSGTLTADATATGSNLARAWGIEAFYDYDVAGSSSISNTGLIEVSATAGLSALAVAIEAGNLYDSSSLSNAGDITATSAGASGYAYGISTGSLYDSASVSNDASGTLSATITADTHGVAFGISAGALNGDALVGNAGTISASATSVSSVASAYGISVGQMFDNASVTSSGTITATAVSGDSNANAWGIYTEALYDNAALINSGDVSATATALQASGAGYGLATGSLNGDASVLNDDTGTLNVTVTGGSKATAKGMAIGGMHDGSSVSNAGTISAAATAHSGSALAWGIDTGGMAAGAVSNSGSLTVMSTGASYAVAYGLGLGGVATLDGIEVTNTDTGTIAASTIGQGGYSYASAYGIHAYSSLANDALISNAGTISATTLTEGSQNASAWGVFVLGMTDASISNSGTLTASATGGASAWAGAWGIDASDLSGSSSLGNSGTLSAIATAGSSASAYGFRVASLSGASSLANSGDILASVTTPTGEGYAFGVATGTLNDTASISNTAAGTIAATVTADTWASAYGITADGVNGAGSISNAGTITATATSLHSSASAWGIDTGSLTGGSVANSGSITATVRVTNAHNRWAGAYAIGNLDGATADAVTLTNTADGTLLASARGDRGSVYGIYASGSLTNGSSIVNAGTITATFSGGDGSVASAFGIFANSLVSSSVSNSGIISATATGGGDGVFAYGITVNAADNGSSVVNTDTITVAATATGNNPVGEAYGILVNNLAAGATITNSGTITVTGSEQFDLKGIVVNDGSGLVDNNAGIINSGVKLGGTVSMLNNGVLRLAPGQASYVGGNYTQGGDGVLITQVRSVSDYGRISVGGTADLSPNGALRVELDPGLLLADGDVLTDVVSASSVLAPSSGIIVDDESQFWNFTNVGDAGSIDLRADQVDAGSVFAGAGAGVAFTDSQLAAVNAIVGGQYGSQYATLTQLLNTSTSPDAAAALVAQLLPTFSGAVGSAVRGASRSVGALIGARQAETGAASGDASSGNALWIKTFVGNADQDKVAGIDGFSAHNSGFVIGVDGAVSDSWRLGVAVAQATTDADAVLATTAIDTLQFSLYGRYAVSDSTAFDVNVDHAVNNVDSTRQVAFVSSTAVANYAGQQTALGLALTHRAEVCSGFAVLPSVSVRYHQLHLDGYNETGAGVYDLSVAGRSDSSLLWQARLGGEASLGSYGTVVGSVGAGYDTLEAASATATLSGTGPTFVSQGAKPESTVLSAGIGYRYVTAKGLEINALLDHESRDTFTANTASLKLRVPF